MISVLFYKRNKTQLAEARARDHERTREGYKRCRHKTIEVGEREIVLVSTNVCKYTAAETI